METVADNSEGPLTWPNASPAGPGAAPGPGAKPLIGMCDAARCLQVTHHPQHRAVWADSAERSRRLLTALPRSQRDARARVQADVDRSLHVVGRHRPGGHARGGVIVPRISADGRARNEQAVRVAMDRLLRGEVPAGGHVDLKTLVAEAGIPRTGFYAKRNRDGTVRRGPYQHLAEEFDRRLQRLREVGMVPDPRDSQIERQRQANDALRERLRRRDAEIAELKAFRQRTLSQLAAQDAELQRLRGQLQAGVRRLRPPEPDPAGPCGWDRRTRQFSPCRRPLLHSVVGTDRFQVTRKTGQPISVRHAAGSLVSRGLTT
ncbi:coiled-coil domain-containing protein [Actinacidiphila paucisporea]|uniref:Uncharacterized protein n=1 Tax=Actinacidiphila paucisporea TaxID=310782 RepID=A0A1M7QN72_9ACTN|nr:hypothetical protein [Actinacidiphila paucisporea]SHN32770.1 hypothetical protein SAMN05216499_13831 [Actinacidiphila paucisporea]